MIRGVLFDMDGVLLNSEEYHYPCRNTDVQGKGI